MRKVLNETWKILVFGNEDVAGKKRMRQKDKERKRMNRKKFQREKREKKRERQRKTEKE